MTNCDFVTIGETVLPAVAGVQLLPEYLTDSERSISGMLRTDHTAIARRWRVTLRGVPGPEVYPLLAVLQSPVAPQFARVFDVETLVEVRVDNVTHRPRIRSARPDYGRADMVLTLTEVTPETVGAHEVFLASGVWDWAAAGSPETVDVLLVGGGGAGGSEEEPGDGGGGGGAGGVRFLLGVPVSGDVTVTVGLGGVTNSGQATSFGALEALGGGAGGRTPSAGGSGGGSTGRNVGPQTPPGAPGATGQGHAGGEGSWGGRRAGGGGGGAAGAGTAGDLPAGQYSVGGAGVILAQHGWGVVDAPIAVAGGGGGGLGQGTSVGGSASHGGGHGGAVGTPGGDAQANTGGGGGGGGNANGGRGGSGLVIVRWRA